MPRRQKIVMLPCVIGAAGVVSRAFSYGFTNRFDILVKNPIQAISLWWSIVVT